MQPAQHHGSNSVSSSFSSHIHMSQHQIGLHSSSIHQSIYVNQGFHGGNTWGKIAWVFLFIKYLGMCHEEPLSISHFHFLYSILCPSIPIISHPILTLHHFNSCTSTSKSYPTSHLPKHKKMPCCFHTRTSNKKLIKNFIEELVWNEGMHCIQFIGFMID